MLDEEKVFFVTFSHLTLSPTHLGVGAERAKLEELLVRAAYRKRHVVVALQPILLQRQRAKLHVGIFWITVVGDGLARCSVRVWGPEVLCGLPNQLVFIKRICLAVLVFLLPQTALTQFTLTVCAGAARLVDVPVVYVRGAQTSFTCIIISRTVTNRTAQTSFF